MCIDYLGHNWFVEADEEEGAESSRPTDTVWWYSVERVGSVGEGSVFHPSMICRPPRELGLR